jgi:hypothetical protein
MARGESIIKILLRPAAPFLSVTRDGGTLNAFASCRITSLLALPSVGGAVVFMRSWPSLTPRISLRLPRGLTRTAMTISRVSGNPRRPGQTGMGLYVCNMIIAACKRMMTKTGDMSRPPIGGIMRRNGRSAGSATAFNIAVTGL